MICVAARPGSTFVVEDHDLVRSLLAAWFAARGHRVRAFGPDDLDDLDDIVRDDLVVLDLCLGERDGVEVLQTLAERHFAGGVILISSFSDAVIETARSVATDFGLHVVGALRKPLDFDQLDALLRAAARPPVGLEAVGPAPPSLGDALARGDVGFHYQPILDALTGDLCSVELLARLRLPSSRAISIDTALDGASVETLHALAHLAVADAARLAQHLRDWGIGALEMAINVPSSFVQRCHIAPVLDRLDRTGPALTLEVSELDSFAGMDEARRATTSAVLHGLRFSLDDFGTLNSNVDRLMHLPFTEVKIDRAFVDGCAGNAFRAAVCRSAVRLARLRHAVVVAEGVETAEDFEFLRRIGVDRVQGYLFARPMPADALVDWILARRPAPAATGRSLRARRLGGTHP